MRGSLARQALAANTDSKKYKFYRWSLLAAYSSRLSDCQSSASQVAARGEKRNACGSFLQQAGNYTNRYFKIRPYNLLMTDSYQTPHQKKSFRQLIDFLGLRRSVVAVLMMAVLVGMGEKIAERFLPIYILALGGSNIAIGLLNGMDNLLSALYSFPGGYLSDKLGYKRALLVFNLISLFGYGIVILFPT